MHELFRDRIVEWGKLHASRIKRVRRKMTLVIVTAGKNKKEALAL
jgi:hypothetical protein